MRLFIAIEIPAEIKQEITKVQEQLRRAGAEAGWTRPEGIHLTLKFLGEVAEAKVPDIVRALTAAVRGMSGFGLEVAGAGAFPNVKSPRVVWLGVGGELDKLTPLAAAVERAMQAMGFGPESRLFSPHLTLARVKYLKPRFSWQEAIETIKDVKPGKFRTDRVSLMKSELKREGAVYTEVGSVELK